MPIVPASVHFARLLRGVFGAVFFLNGQGIHIRAIQDGGPARIPFEDADDAGAADAGLHFQSKRVQLLGDNARRPMFFKSQFRMPVEITPALDQFVSKRLGFPHKVN